jgi:hypothetical protein
MNMPYLMLKNYAIFILFIRNLKNKIKSFLVCLILAFQYYMRHDKETIIFIISM